MNFEFIYPDERYCLDIQKGKEASLTNFLSYELKDTDYDIYYDENFYFFADKQKVEAPAIIIEKTVKSAKPKIWAFLYDDVVYEYDKDETSIYLSALSFFDEAEMEKIFRTIKQIEITKITEIKEL